MKTKILSFLIWGIVLIGLNGVWGLVRNEYVTGNGCPKLIGIPACYIIFTCLILILVSEINVLKDRSKLFWVGAGVAWLIAAVGATGQYFGWLECPKTVGGTPMCYLSFAMFTSLLLLKVLEGKSKGSSSELPEEGH